MFRGHEGEAHDLYKGLVPSFKKKKEDTRVLCLFHLRTQQEGEPLCTRKRALNKQHTGPTMILNFPDSGAVRNTSMA